MTNVLFHLKMLQNRHPKKYFNRHTETIHVNINFDTKVRNDKI
jgi:hypothetical protein